MKLLSGGVFFNLGPMDERSNSDHRCRHRPTLGTKQYIEAGIGLHMAPTNTSELA
jgi:hypothetical protein